jgi:hypothetical protein
MLAYHVESHMRQRLAPLLFDEHDLDQCPFSSVVSLA